MLSSVITEECSKMEQLNRLFTEAVDRFEMFDHNSVVYTWSELASKTETDVEEKYVLDKGLESGTDKENSSKKVEEDGNRATEKWVQQINDYVDKNYSDQALNISHIAYRFHMNPAYLGRRYKELAGVGLLEYIHRARIDKAEKLLDSGMLMKDVAEKVGFTNTLTMRRAFGRYRE